MKDIKIKLAFAIFVIAFGFLSSSSVTAHAAPIDQITICHFLGNGDYNLVDASDSAVYDAHKNHGDKLWNGSECVSFPITCPTGQTLEGDVCVPITCPTGQTLEGDVCVDPQTECPTGEILVDNQCVEVPSECVEGFELVGDQCIEIQQPITLNEENDGGSNSWDTRPTFGISHETRDEIIVDNGFRFNDQSFAIVDNHHTPFTEQFIELGTVNSFAAKVYADKNLKVQEFLFGVPQVGLGHLAEMRVEVWFDYDGEITDVKVNQKTEIIDRSSLIITHQKSKCQESDIEEKCDTTFMSAVFLEPLKDKVMAIKAMDFKLRDQTTYLNEGFDISGDSLNPLPTKMIPSNVKGEGLVKVTQTEKYSDYWASEDGRVFEMNSFGSFNQVNQEFHRFQDSGDAKTRLHSDFANKIKLEAEKATGIFDASQLSYDCNFVECK